LPSSDCKLRSSGCKFDKIVVKTKIICLKCTDLENNVYLCSRQKGDFQPVNAESSNGRLFVCCYM
jgi:hypothetical protein